MRLPDVSTPEAREQARKDQHARYLAHLRTARRCRELAMITYSESKRRRLMAASDDALSRAHYEVA